jgi:ABC-type lipoprotein export system ATPase subunit
MIKIEDLSKNYIDRSNTVKALDQINLNLPNHGMVFVIGKSGSGKTTLLYILGGLLKQSDGNIVRKDHLDMFDIRRRTGFIFQNYNLFNDMTVKKNLKVSSSIKLKKTNEEEIDRLLDKFEISNLKNKKASYLSGGEQQRVTIARALLHDPDIILADEPTGNLDQENSFIVNQTLKKISETKLVVYVTHDIKTAFDYGDMVIELKSGKIKKITQIKDISNEKIEKSKNYTKISNIKTLISFSHRFLFNKPIRFVLSIFSFIISSLLFLLILSLSNYKETEVISKYIKDYNIDRYVFYEQNEYLDLFNQTITNNIYKGEDLFLSLDEHFEEKQISRILLNKYSLSINQAFNIIFYDEQIKNDLLTFSEGFIGVELDEIAISDYLAYSNNINLEDSIIIDGNTYKIKGIFQTDFESTSYIAKKNYGYLTDLDQFEEKYTYLSIYMSKNNLNNYIENEYIDIKHNYLMYNPTLQYSYAMSLKTKPINDDLVLLHGRMPLNSNEALVSSTKASFLNLIINDNFNETTLNFYNFNDSKFNNSYSNVINMFDYYIEGVTITGVVVGDDDLFFIDENIFQEVNRRYHDYYFIDEFIVFDKDLIDKETISSFNNNIYINEPMIKLIYHMSQLFETYWILLVTLLIIFTILTLFMLLTLFLNSFYQSIKEIAILQSLGLTNKNLVLMFFIQLIELLVISFILLIAFYLVSIYGINSYFNEMIKSRIIKIYLFDHIALYLTMLKMIFIGITINTLLINRALKTDMINSIKSS